MLISIQLCLLEHFHGVLMLVALAAALEDSTKGTMTEHLQDVERLKANAMNDTVVHEHWVSLTHLLDIVRR